MRGILSESETVKYPIVGYAKEIGWQHIPPETSLLMRRGERGVLFYELLANQLMALNSGTVDASNVSTIVNRIENYRSNIEGNKEVLAWLKGERSIFSKNQNREINVRLIDFENLDANVFSIAEEWEYTNGRYTNRADIVLLINGIPVAIVETKAAHVRDGVDKGIVQVRRYHDETPEMVTLPQVFNVPNIMDFYYGPTWSLERKNLFNWKDEDKGNFERKVKHFFDRRRIVRVIGSYILFFEKDGELGKVLLRQHQIRAVERTINRCKEKSKPRSLIWHTQGAGKTITMLTVANHLLTGHEFEKPTVILLVDRNELEGQLSGVLRAFRGTEVPVAQTKEHLGDLLRSDYRGLIVSTIHKFDKMPANVNKRPNVFVLVDEAHRTTTGDLGNYLVASLPNATLVGFTGTPIDDTSRGKGTFKVFGKYDETGYLDKYSIAESIEDGTTLPLKYTLAPSKLLVPKEQLEQEFLSLKEAEGISDVQDLNRILDRAVNLKNFLKSRSRVTEVAQFIANHYRNNVESLGYKAFVVGVDREACVLLKEALDKFLPPEYSKVVYSPVHNDDAALRRHYLSEDEEKNVRKAFVDPNMIPKVLIVTEKLLTGFDAPILYCMYLDKPMRDHVLLQAIARVNRPFERDPGTKKPCGLVIDFIGLFEKLEKALAFDSDTVASVIENIDVLKSRFEYLMKSKSKSYLDLVEGRKGDKLVEHILDFFGTKGRRDGFVDYFREIEGLYEIISPDQFLRPFLDNYLLLAKIYDLVVSARSVRPLRDLMKKTEALVRQRVSIEGLDGTMKLYPIDETTLRAIRKESTSDSSRVINLAKSLAVAVDGVRETRPFLIPIGERAASILESFDDRQVGTADALNSLEQLLDEYNHASQEMVSKGMDVGTFSIYWILRRNGVKNAEAVAIQVRSVLDRFPNRKDNKADLRLLKADLYKVFMPAVGKTQMIDLVEKLLQV